ncbi:MAG TPA: flagellar hook-associated protein FlgL [Tepidisphaeraceae bacterium]
MAVLPLNMARVSNLLRTNLAQDQITRTQQSLLGVQNELSTGKRLNQPSDDPGAAAIAQQLRKTLEQRDAFSNNLKAASSQLGEVDSTLGDLTGLIQQAQTIASSNVGSDVSQDQRNASAEIVKSLYSQLLSVANKQFDGVYLFAGDRATAPPFVEQGGGVKFVGSKQVLQNQFDENTTLPFMVDGDEVFGALSQRIQGTADLTPSVTAVTRLTDLRGATQQGVRPGAIRIGDGSTTTAVVDLSKADSVGDVVNSINAAGIGSITAAINPAGGITLSTAGADDITVTDVGGGTMSGDLGISTPVGAGAGAAVTGTNLAPKITALTPLADLKNGAGIDLASGIQITNGLLNATVSFASPPLRPGATVEDLLNTINASGTAVRAEINDAGNGINILNPTQGTQMTIAENGGATASDLGLRSFNPNTSLGELNGGRGLSTNPAGNDIQITRADGTSFQVDLSAINDVQGIINAINAAAGTPMAGFKTSGNGIQLTDTSVGSGTFAVTSINFSGSAEGLGLTGPAAAGVISGADVNPVAATGMFSNIGKLRDALQQGDQQAITAAAEGLQADYNRVVQIRGQTGAQVQDLQSRQNRLEDENVATKSLLSSLEDTDFTDAITRFQTLQTSLQATLQTSGKILNMSLLDFLS